MKTPTPNDRKSTVPAGGGWISRTLPGRVLVRHYRRSHFGHDLLASLVAALVLIPSAFACADFAKCAPSAGLYAVVSSMVVFALFTTSRHVIVGPDAAVTLLVGAAIQKFDELPGAGPGTPELLNHPPPALQM